MTNQELYERIRQGNAKQEIQIAMHDRVRQMVCGLLPTIGPELLERVVSRVFEVVASEPNEAWAVERISRLLSRKLGDFSAKLGGRSGYIQSLITPHAQGSILDYGCGDGLVSAVFIGESDIQIYDVIDYRDVSVQDLPFTTDRAALDVHMFDTALVLTVLHHAEDPDAELKWLAAHAKRLVVIESVVSDLNAWPVQALVDWFYNRCLHPDANVPVPGSFRSTEEWRETFASYGFKITHEHDLGIDIEIAPEHHVLFVLDR